jgi:hypothetical protein
MLASTPSVGRTEGAPTKPFRQTRRRDPAPVTGRSPTLYGSADIVRLGTSRRRPRVFLTS